MRVLWVIAILIISVALTLSACTSPATSPTVSLNTDLMVTGKEFVRQIIDTLPEKSQWIPPLPPSGGEKPRILTEEEKNRVLNIASVVPQVVEAKQNKDVVNVDTRYLWVGWNGNPDGVSYKDYEAVERGGDISTMGDNCYPAVDFVFNSRFGEYGRAGFHVAVNLETGKVVYLGGFDSSTPLPQKLPHN